MVWAKRTLGIALLSFGLVLLATPFPSSLSGTTETFRLASSPAPLNMDEARARFGTSIVELTGENLEATPGLRQEMVWLWNTGGTACVVEEEWSGLGTLIGEPPAPGTVFAFRDSLQRITEVEVRPDEEDVCFTTERVASFDSPDFNPAARLDREALQAYPEVLAAVSAGSASGSDAGPEGPPISGEEWERFRRRELPRDSIGADSFVIGGTLFQAEEDVSSEERSQPTPWLRPGAMLVGSGLAIGGVLLLLGAYRLRASRPGIPTQPVGVALFLDGLALIAASFVALGCIDALWSAGLGQSGLLPDLTGAVPGELSAMGFVSLLGVVFGLPILTLAFSLITEQRVLIDEKGVTSLGVAGRAFVPWGELEEVRLGGKRSERLVEVVGRHRTVSIWAASSSCREKVKAALLQYAPADKQHLLRDALTAW